MLCEPAQAALLSGLIVLGASGRKASSNTPFPGYWGGTVAPFVMTVIELELPEFSVQVLKTALGIG